METQGRSIPWVSIYGRLKYGVDVSTKPTKVLVSSFKLDRTQYLPIRDMVRGLRWGCWSGFVPLRKEREVNHLRLSDLDELDLQVSYWVESVFRTVHWSRSVPIGTEKDKTSSYPRSVRTWFSSLSPTWVGFRVGYQGGFLPPLRVNT